MSLFHTRFGTIRNQTIETAFRALGNANYERKNQIDCINGVAREWPLLLTIIGHGYAFKNNIDERRVTKCAYS